MDTSRCLSEIIAVSCFQPKLLAGLLELLPWLKQWHNEPNPTYGIGMGDFFEDFVEAEAHSMDKTVVAIKNWKP